MKKDIENFPLEMKRNPLTIELGLERIERVLLYLASPHLAFESLLVAGTNGKGSTASMIASIVSSSGKKVGLYTSPHLNDVEERISINGTNISRERFFSISQKIESLPIIKNRKTELTYFEFITVVAFIYFAEEGVDLAVLEVGLGGRLDATNVVNPLVSVITEIGIDHSEVLGNSIAKIAREKGGIIRCGGTVVLSSGNREAIEAINSICEKKKAELYLIGRDFGFDILGGNNSGQRIDFWGAENIKDIQLSLVGLHQAKNGAAAIETALLLNEHKLKVAEKEIRGGMGKSKIAGRLEVIKSYPTILLDIAHNCNGALALVDTIKKNFKYRKLFLILGILKDKDIAGIVSILVPLADKIFVVRLKSERGASPGMIFSEVKKNIFDECVVAEIEDAIKEAELNASDEDLICITGSVITVGEARRICLIEKSIDI